MNKENKSVDSLHKTYPKPSSSVTNLKGLKVPTSLSAQVVMPQHKSIDLNLSKKNSSTSSPTYNQQQQQQSESNVSAFAAGKAVQPWQSSSQEDQQPQAVTAGALQKLFLEQKKRQNDSTMGTAEQSPLSEDRHTVLRRAGTSEFENPRVKELTSESVVEDHGASRRFSVFSKSSFATSSSFLFGTRILNKSAMAAKNMTPKVNISSIFKNKAYLYLDEALINTFDDLLDKGHQIVTQRKEERGILGAQELAMRAEWQELEKEIVPLLQRVNACNEQIMHQGGLQSQYENEIAVLLDDLSSIKAQIFSRTKEVSDAHDDFTNTIKQMEIRNNEIRSDIHINKACHRQEANQQAIHKKQKQAEMEELTKQLIGLKAEYEQKRMAQADRLRKMENKQKMYMGILKH